MITKINNKSNYNIKSYQKKILEANPSNIGQRIDNFLLSHLKYIPKDYIYKIIRKGKVLINEKKIKVGYKIKYNDLVMIPPVKTLEKKIQNFNLHNYSSIRKRILFENEYLIILNKPAGLPVHSGTNSSYGLIEILKEIKNKYNFLELAHRLDKGTSGCIIIAKKKIMLNALHDLFKTNKIKKIYHALMMKNDKNIVNEKVEIPIIEYNKRKGEGKGKRKEKQKYKIKKTHSNFKLIKEFKECILAEIKIKTGRKHQIRIHALSLNSPICGDEKYGNQDFNKKIKKIGLKRLFLHANNIEFKCPITKKVISTYAPYDYQLSMALKKIKVEQYNE